MSEWEQVFGAPWFWIAAALVWARAASSAFGASPRLIKAAKRDPDAARLALHQVCWRLGPGRLLRASLEPLRWPVVGFLCAVLLGEGAFGEYALALALLTVFGPPLAARMALEPRVLVAAMRADGGAPDTLTAFLTALEDAWKARLASVLVAAAVTVCVAIAFRP